MKTHTERCQHERYARVTRPVQLSLTPIAYKNTLPMCFKCALRMAKLRNKVSLSLARSRTGSQADASYCTGLPDGVEQLRVQAGTLNDSTKLDYGDQEDVMTRLPFRFDGNDDDDGTTECMITGYLKRKMLSTPGWGAPIPRPAEPTYRIMDSPGQGLGMYAIRDIAAGDLILAERPFLITPVAFKSRSMTHMGRQLSMAEIQQVTLNDAEKVLEVLVGRMTPEDKRSFMSLRNSHEQDGSGPILGRIRTNGFSDAQIKERGMSIRLFLVTRY